MRKFDEIFDVYSENEKYTFLYCNISNKKELIDKYFDYFFDEEIMFQHFNHLYEIPFTPTKENYIKLFRELKKFIDDYNFEFLFEHNEETSEFEKVLIEENQLKTDGYTFKYRYDKAGKIGEYFFAILLERFFGLTCIIPKTKYLTDYNMSVYGIDVVYMCEDDGLLYFGESKFTKKLYSGIVQINESLSTYEKQVSDEYELIFNGWDARMNLKKLYEKYGDILDKSITIKDFINAANISEICIPLFIAHGNEIVPTHILEELDKIKKITLFNLNTKYLIISLPIVDKEEFIQAMSKKISSRMAEYGEY